MILTVNHVTTYDYDAPMGAAVQSLRLFPSRFDGQRTIDWSVSVEGGVKGGAFRDGAGDRVEGWSIRPPVEAVTVTVTGQVETFDTSGVLRGHRELVHPMAYLRETVATWIDDALQELGESAVEGASDMLDRAHRLSSAVAEAIAYKPGVTHTHTTAAEALTQGEGVCQDHAHALIAAARAVDMPARYVSGYLFATEDGAPHEAAHAWAEIWVEGIGWIGFDPANACCPDERYIRLGSGLDAREAAPIRGITQGAGEERLDVTVALEQLQQ
ncbi:MAG: transglutaminase family protein [Thioclava marina]|jgi:transglutaminase-like putative cysteine protease|uniref:Transglutaminase n=1 Tax=Thioclava marina TaxID=1915077 RepID=A0ABX3MP68_9RHOB|nr:MULTISPECIES: transglutaminase family protein [Thioclava]TNE83712.1 MAG: transglutaminase family protein [Paracoccaceae bacterium]MBC7145228.1 transglutaminase family protein [Thioclava marina]MBD3804015.1 transglutaminase family protein [Thioclava sp.]OOY13332.1 transglutaminase [Thioclava marina]OOY29043.1 transglutaminase [Thioclava sp. L04-15]